MKFNWVKIESVGSKIFSLIVISYGIIKESGMNISLGIMFLIITLIQDKLDERINKKNNN